MFKRSRRLSDNRPGSESRSETRRTVKVAGVVLRLQLGDELGLLPQQAVPVQLGEERVLLHLEGASCGDGGQMRETSVRSDRL